MSTWNIRGEWEHFCNANRATITSGLWVKECFGCGVRRPNTIDDPNEERPTSEEFWDIVGRRLESEIRILIREEIRNDMLERNRDAINKEIQGGLVDLTKFDLNEFVFLPEEE